MENLRQLTEKAIQPQKWSGQSVQALSVTDYPSNELSAFAKLQPADKATIANAVAHFAVLFPSMSPAFWMELTDAIRTEQWPIERLRYAYLRVRATHRYNTITIADIISVDKKYRIYHYEETDGRNFVKLKGHDKWARKCDYLENPAVFDVHPNSGWIVDEWMQELREQAI